MDSPLALLYFLEAGKSCVMRLKMRTIESRTKKSRWTFMIVHLKHSHMETKHFLGRNFEHVLRDSTFSKNKYQSEVPLT